MRLKQLEKSRERDGMADASELKKHKEQVQHEKRQLKEKIAQLKAKTSKIEGFNKLLSVTGRLRRCQEEESKNQERMQILRTQIENNARILHEREEKLELWRSMTRRQPQVGLLVARDWGK